MGDHLALIFFLLIFSQGSLSALICSRYPSNTLTPKSPVDENFAVLINNNPQTYILGQEYNITINAYNSHRYIGFSLALENDNGYFNLKEDLGQFKIIDPIETRFSPNCINMVESTNTHPKVHTEVTWIAPTDPNSGCVLIRATLLQHRDVWHMDDGGLTRRICQEVVDENENRRTNDVQECCACDEARYDLTFQGVWNRNLHPKDFPPQGWVARFGDIIGAAHIADYRFWQDGELANDGMREYAEHGSSRTLEKDFNLNFQAGAIRTIIKARGPAFPNLNGISVASVRVDPKHHFISLASKIDPSPDWFVGVSGLELCMQNCTWIEEKVIQLYPWDAGTDAGPSYTSADQPQVPPDVIRRMRPNFPNDPRSPFYDETGAAMAPLATLIIKRQRIYERTCEDEESNNYNVPRECFTHPWTRWPECSVRCGEGHTYRTRVYKQPELAKLSNCDNLIELREDRACMGENCTGVDVELLDGVNINRNIGKCEFTPWNEYSPCSNTCGEGTMVRRRTYKGPKAQRACELSGDTKLVDYEKCIGKLCLGDLEDRRRPQSTGENIYEEDSEENGIFNRHDPPEYNNNGNEYWNSAVGNDMQESRGGQNFWNGANSNNNNNNNNNRETEKDRNQYWSGAAPPFQSVAYDNEQENVALEPEDPDEMNQNQFEIGNLQRGNVDFHEDPRNYKNSLREYQSPGRIESTQIDGNSQRNSIESGNQQQRQPIEMKPQCHVPSYCFEQLRVFNCHNLTVIGNFWFYNYCEDECMLYAADRCDRNNNKFNTLEACESTCQRSLNEPYLRYVQARTCNTTDNRRSNKRRKQGGNWKSQYQAY